MLMTTFRAVALGLAGFVALTGSVDAGPRQAASPAATVDDGLSHPQSSNYRRGPQVRGFIQRRGGYSYKIEDTINTYGASNGYRSPFYDRQTSSGPFDNGFFFDSGISPRGGDSPYRN